MNQNDKSDQSDQDDKSEQSDQDDKSDLVADQEVWDRYIPDLEGRLESMLYEKRGLTYLPKGIKVLTKHEEVHHTSEVPVAVEDLEKGVELLLPNGKTSANGRFYFYFYVWLS